MEKRYGSEDHYKNLEKHRQDSDNLRAAKENSDLADEFFEKAATTEEKEAARQLLTEAIEKFKQVRLDYEKTVAEGKEIGDLEKNYGLLIEAYGENLKVLEERSVDLHRQIEDFKKILADTKLEVAIGSQKIPGWIVEEVKYDGRACNRIRYLFLDIFNHAKDEGKLPKDGGMNEEMENIWEQAYEAFKNEEKFSLNNRRILQSGWLPHHKRKI